MSPNGPVQPSDGTPTPSRLHKSIVAIHRPPHNKLSHKLRLSQEPLLEYGVVFSIPTPSFQDSTLFLPPSPYQHHIIQSRPLFPPRTSPKPPPPPLQRAPKINLWFQKRLLLSSTPQRGLARGRQFSKSAKEKGSATLCIILSQNLKKKAGFR